MLILTDDRFLQNIPTELLETLLAKCKIPRFDFAFSKSDFLEAAIGKLRQVVSSVRIEDALLAARPWLLAFFLVLLVAAIVLAPDRRR